MTTITLENILLSSQTWSLELQVQYLRAYALTIGSRMTVGSVQTEHHFEQMQKFGRQENHIFVS
jgi:hypothetical protein